MDSAVEKLTTRVPGLTELQRESQIRLIDDRSPAAAGAQIDIAYWLESIRESSLVTRTELVDSRSQQVRHQSHGAVDYANYIGNFRNYWTAVGLSWRTWSRGSRTSQRNVATLAVGM